MSSWIPYVPYYIPSTIPAAPIPNPDDSDFIIVNADGTRWPVRLDSKVCLMGTYDPSLDRTSWVLPYEHTTPSGEIVVGVTGPDFIPHGTILTLTVSGVDNQTVWASGDHTSNCVIFGYPYIMCVELSKIYVREGEKSGAVTSGRLQLNKLGLNYKDTGYFTVEVTPEFRPTHITTFTGRIIGKANNKVGEQPIVAEGTLKARVGSRAETVKIRICNDKHIPCTITSGWWRGFFNEISRQEG